MDDLMKKSRYMSKLLRHNSEDLNIDNSGYVIVSELLDKLDITINDLDYIVDNNDKKRFAYNNDKTKIRASQGHNNKMNVSITMKEADRVEVLYHGTATKNVTSILKSGLLPHSRKHVHMSKDLETARKVALRHSKDITIFTINTAKMRADGVKIYISDNNVYLTDKVETKYLNI